MIYNGEGRVAPELSHAKGTNKLELGLQLPKRPDQLDVSICNLSDSGIGSHCFSAITVSAVAATSPFRGR